MTTKALAVAAAYLAARSANEGTGFAYSKFKATPDSVEANEALQKWLDPLLPRLEASGVPAYFACRYVNHIFGGAAPTETLENRFLAALGVNLLTFSLSQRPMRFCEDARKLRDEMWAIADATKLSFSDVAGVFKAALDNLIRSVCYE